MNRARAVFNVEFGAGAEIGPACHEAQRLAEKLDSMIRFDFNGVSCTAIPFGDADLLAERQQRQQASREQYKFCNSRRWEAV